MKTAPPFQCISYSWGPDTKDHRLELHEGHFVRLNKSLAEALPYLQPRYGTGYLWIDQICIHQQSSTKSNHQVKIMGDICSDAKETLIWPRKDIWLGKEWTKQDMVHLNDLFTTTEKAIDLRESASVLIRTWVFQELI